MNLQVHPEVAGVAEGFATVLALVRFHPHMAHEVHLEFSGCNERPSTHAAFEFLLPHVALTFCPGGNVIRVSITAAPAAGTGVSVCLPCSRIVTGPRGRGGARGFICQLLFLVRVLLGLLLLLLLLLSWWLLLLIVVLL